MMKNYIEKPLNYEGLKGNKFTSQNPAFTLAEVLITLAIIGIVAALTIPTVITNYQKTQTVTQLKKVYSTLSNAINMGQAQNGILSSSSTNDFYTKYLKPNLNMLKECQDYTGECDNTYSYLNNPTPIIPGNQNYPHFILADGTLVRVVIGAIGDSANGSAESYSTHISIFVDVNGPLKKPNVVGKDIFVFMYSDKPVEVHFTSGSTTTSYIKTTKEQVGRLIGYQNTKQISSSNGQITEHIDDYCKKGSNGATCADKIMRDGWQIKSDYPW